MLQAVAEFFNLLHAFCLHYKSEQSAGTLHLLFGQGVLRKTFIKWKEDSFYFVMLLQVTDYLLCCLCYVLQPHWQSTQPTYQQPGIKR